ncbi:MAG: epoxyqueuosine reductase [Bacteroidota bacterium]|nr:epoxyqueuosine reductase [Bacteroidota bacterium]
MNAVEVKKLVLESGADLCGIAPISRFDQAPDGFNPVDIYPEVKSVVVFAKKIPESVLYAKSVIPYTFADDMALAEVLRISLDVSVKLEKNNIRAVPVPSEPYEYWDKETMTGKGIISLKHAAYYAGLGVMGRNTLLCNPDLGNMLKLGAVLANVELEPDPVIDDDFCSDSCNLCVKSCPSGALTMGNRNVIQKNCRLNSEGKTLKGSPITVCYNCRKVCPNRGGWKKSRKN